MSAVTATRLNPFDTLRAEMPSVIDGRTRLADGTYPGESVDPREPGAVLPGSFVFEQDAWLRVIEVAAAPGGTAVRCGRGSGVTLTVPSGNSVSVWRVADVVTYRHAGGEVL